MITIHEELNRLVFRDPPEWPFNPPPVIRLAADLGVDPNLLWSWLEVFQEWVNIRDSEYLSESQYVMFQQGLRSLGLAK